MSVHHVSSVGVAVNPWAGKDLRRLHGPVGHTPDTAKIGIVRRVIVGALEAGASMVYLAADVGRIAERAGRGITGVQLVDGPGTGSPLDTRRAASQFCELGCRAVVVLGGDGTCRDVAIGWPDVIMISISTGTNNVFPRFVDGSSAGTAAGLVACGRIETVLVARRSKRLLIEISSGERELALVDVAVIAGSATGARAVVDPLSIRAVVAAIASPMSTGLSSIAGRIAPLGPDDDGAVVVRTGGDERLVRVPIVPGRFDQIAIESVEPLAVGERVVFEGPCVLAYDGERDRVVPADTRAAITVDRAGPHVVDVERTLWIAADRRLFDATTASAGENDRITSEANHGD